MPLPHRPDPPQENPSPRWVASQLGRGPRWYGEVPARTNIATNFRKYFRHRSILCVIPEKRVPAGKRRRRRGRPPAFCRTTYQQRIVIERLVGWLKEHRRLATRFEKLASSFMEMMKLSFVRRYLRMLERSSRRTYL